LQATDNNMAHAHFVLDTCVYKYTQKGCVILIAFPLQQWLHERSSVLLYTYVASLVCPTIVHCGRDDNQNIAVHAVC